MSFDPIMALTELQERNRLRASSSLPVLDIEAELKRRQRVEQQTAFSAYLDLHRSLYHRALRRAIFRRGRAYGNLNWRPHSFQAWEFENHVRRLFWRRFLDAGSTLNKFALFHSNRTPKSQSTAEVDTAFKPVKKRDVPEFNARLYRENEEREWEKKIAALHKLRLQHEAANPSTNKQQRKQRRRQLVSS